MKASRPTTELFKRQCPRVYQELEEAIRASGCVINQMSFVQLAQAIQQTDDFMEKTLPFMWLVASQSADILPDIPLLNMAGSVVLTQHQCLCVLANAFFCTFHDRPSYNCLSDSDMPSINFDELYGGYGLGRVKIAKLRMLFNYFELCRLRLINGDPMTRPIHSIRRQAEFAKAADWERCNAPFTTPVVHPLGESLDEAKGMLRVDFANRIIGGAAIAYGCVQEEIMFCICPELIVTRLLCPAMASDEAIVIIGAEQFSTPIGYGNSLDFGGVYIDSTPLHKGGGLASYIVAIDALDLRNGNADQQYKPELILRELCKAWAGFDVTDVPLNVATGNWGCGVFEGDAELKSLIQWMAISRSGKVMHYFPWSDEAIYYGLPELAEVIMNRGVSVGELSKIMFNNLQTGRVYSQLRSHFKVRVN
jgi:poly(ADP-ribose) glycohydrolase